VLSDAAGAVSVLRSLAEVDQALVGAMGHSYAGNITLFLAAVEVRVGLAAASGAACANQRRMRDATGIEIAEVIPGVAAALDIDDLVRAIAPRPLLLVSGEDDKYAADADETTAAAAPTYASIEAGNLLIHVRSGRGHRWDGDRLAEVCDWALSHAFPAL
jgi:dienelactone hydrolase